MKYRFLFATAILGGLLMTGCQKENLSGIPEGAIMLTTEGYQGNDTKTSVNNTDVQWVGGESVTINSTNYDVSVSNGKAYIEPTSGTTLTAPLFGYYSCGNVSNIQFTSASTTSPSSVSATVTIPD